MQTLFQDLAYGWRMLRKSPGLTAVILIMLMLGIGANTAVYTIFDALLLRPLGYEKPEQLVQIWETRTEGAFQQMEFSYPDYQDMKRLNTSFASVGGFSKNSITVMGPSGAEQVRAAVASTDFFETLGVKTLLGRTFRLAEEKPTKDFPIILSYGSWHRRFGGDANILGRTLTIDGELATVVGVLPKNFTFGPTDSADFWLPFRIDGWRERRNAHWLYPVARLKPGVSQAQAQAELQTLAKSLEAQYPDSNLGVGNRIVDLREQIIGPVQPVLIAVMASIGFVLLITCANIAGLLLARSVPRQREISIRLALGARSWRIARQLFTESVLLSLLGGLAGVFAAYWAVPVLVASLPDDITLAMPPLQGLSVNLNVLLFSLILSVITGILFGLAPVLQVFKRSLQADLQEAGRGAIGFANRRIRNVLVVSEMALAVVLLVGAGLMLKSLNRVLSIDPGFNTKNLLTGVVVLPDKKYPDGTAQNAFQRRLLQEMERLPGVEKAGAVSVVPMSGQGNTSRFDVEGHPKTSGGTEYEANTRTVSQNYFSLMEIPLRAGRFFGSQDREKSPPVLLVNQAMADMVFPGQNPVGKRINFTYTNTPNYYEIIGVVANENVHSLDLPPTPVIYSCFEQDPNSFFSFVVRTSGEPALLAGAVTRLVHESEPEAPVYKLTSMSRLISDSPMMMLRGYPAYLIGGFATLALVLAVLGLYGVLAYSVAQRTRELGVRMALGAQRSDLLRMVVNNGLQLAVLGIVLGIVGGLIVARMIASLLFNVAPTDATTFVSVSVVLFMAALAASYVPALRATRVDPMVALRYE